MIQTDDRSHEYGIRALLKKDLFFEKVRFKATPLIAVVRIRNDARKEKLISSQLSEPLGHACFTLGVSAQGST